MFEGEIGGDGCVGFLSLPRGKRNLIPKKRNITIVIIPTHNFNSMKQS